MSGPTSDVSTVAEEPLLDHRRRNQVRLRRCWLYPEIELVLPSIVQQEPGPFHQDTELSIGMRRPHVSEDLPAPLDVLSDLHGRRPRGRPDPPYPHHTPETSPGLSVRR